MPSMKTLEFTRMPAGRPGDRPLQQMRALPANTQGKSRLGSSQSPCWSPRQCVKGRQSSPLLRRIDKPLRLGETQACTWAVAGAACVRARVHASIAGGL